MMCAHRPYINAPTLKVLGHKKYNLVVKRQPRVFTQVDKNDNLMKCLTYIFPKL